MSSRYPNAIEREAAKLAGVDDHPSDRFDDPMTAKLADLPDQSDTKKPKLKHLGGSKSDRFNIDIANAVLAASWITSKEDQDRLVTNVGHALAGIAPTDELEGMLAGQMIAAHSASMECFRRAMLHEQTFEGRTTNLAQANKAARTYAMLLEALDRHRHKGGEQRVVVEHIHKHVHVHEDRRPQGGGGAIIENPEQPHAARLTHAPGESAAMWSQDAERESLPVARDAERPMQDARRTKPGRAKGSG